MANIFLTILNISITASYIALVALVLRLLLKRNPKWITCILWALLAVRLLVPFSFESRLSLVPSAEPVKSEIVISSKEYSDNSYEISSPQTPVIEQEVPDTPDSPAIEQEVPDNDINSSAESIIPDTSDNSLKEETEQESKLTKVFPVLSYVWSGGVVLMLTYSALSFVRLKRRVRASIPTGKGIYICDDISTPFILGIIKPKIYLPSTLSGEELEYIISHEKAHLKRLDHLWKPLGFVLLSVHWFNPLMWISYVLLCKDIELACDEKVLKSMGESNKKFYSETLLSFSTERRLVSACPLAFGEVGVKQRIKNILNYKKPAFWVIILSLLLCLAIGFCFLTNPVSDKKETENTTESTEFNDIFGNLSEDEDYIAALPINEDSEGYLIYIYTNEENELRNSYVKLYPKGTRFEFSIAKTGTVTETGTYKLIGDRLTLQCENQDANKYVFRMMGAYRLEFKEDESSPLPKIKHSSSEEESVTFKNNAVFRIELSSSSIDKYGREETVPYTYEEIIQSIIAAYPWNDNSKTSPLPDFPYVSYKYISHDNLSEIGYTFIDLDSNGVKELIITGSKMFVYDAYTVIDGKTVHLFTSGDRYSHKLLENGYIQFTWSAGSALSGCDYLKISDGKIEFLERVTLDAWYAKESGIIDDYVNVTDDNCFFKSISESESDYIHITSEEAHEIMDNYKVIAPELEYSLTPLSEYKSGDVDVNSDGYNSVYFDIDRDGEDELCSLSVPEYSSTQTPPLTLTVNDYGAVKDYEISDISIDTSRNTAYNFYIKKAMNRLYIFIEENVGSRTVYELSNNKLYGNVTAKKTNLLDVVDYDINSDGIKETLKINTFNIYSQEYPIGISAENDGYTKYYNEFSLPQLYAVSFEEAKGNLYVNCTTLGTYPTSCKYQVMLENGDLVLDQHGQRIPCWTTGNELNEETRYYTLNVNENDTYSYKIKKSDGTVIESATTSRRPYIINYPDDKLVSVTIQGGTGTHSTSTVFYNIETGKVSDCFWGIVKYKNGLVASGICDTVTISNFSNPELTQTISDFKEPLSNFVENIYDIEFTDDFKRLKVTYYTEDSAITEDAEKATQYFEIDKDLLLP